MEPQKEILGPLENTYISIWGYITNVLLWNVLHDWVNDKLADDVCYSSRLSLEGPGTNKNGIDSEICGSVASENVNSST